MAAYVTTTFTVNMLQGSCKAKFEQLSEREFAQQLKELMETALVIPAVGHENTAQLLKRKLGITRELFNRRNLSIEPGEVVFVAVPKFRPPESREFTDEEIAGAAFTYWRVTIY